MTGEGNGVPKVEDNTNAASSGTSVASHTVIAKINHPEFDPDDVDTWFICLEAAFSVNQIKHDRQKFYAVIVALGPRAKFVHAAIAKCNESVNNDRYETLKAAIMEHFRPSEMQRFSSLLSGMTLGDRKPSVLLSEMRRLGGDGCTDTVLSNLWLRALPNTVRSIIASMPSAPLDEQAKVADKIMEAPHNEISAIKSPEQSSISSLEQRIEALSRRLEEAFSGNSRSRGRSASRHRQQSPGRPSPGRREASRPRAPRRWICWFHYRHGVLAKKCEKQKGENPNIPCIFYDTKMHVYTRPEKN